MTFTPLYPEYAYIFWNQWQSGSMSTLRMVDAGLNLSGSISGVSGDVISVGQACWEISLTDTPCHVLGK